MPAGFFETDTRRNWTTYDLHELDALARAGYGDVEIARRLGRTYDAVKIARRRKLGLITGHKLLYTARSVARLLGKRCSKAVVWWIRNGWLEARHVYSGTGKRYGIWQITEEQLTVFLEDRRYWHLWDAESVTDPDWRSWLIEIRGGERFLTTGQVGARLGFEHSTVSQWVLQGKLPAHRLGYNWRIPESAIRGI